MLTDPRDTEDISNVLDLAKHFPGMAKRRRKKAESVITEEEVTIGKRCAIRVLLAFRKMDPETAFDFAWLVWAEQPENIPNIRFTIYPAGMKLLLDRVFIESEYQENPDSIIGSDRMKGLKAFFDALDYKLGNDLWDQSIHGVIDTGLEISTDNRIIFNEARVLELLDPDERNAFVREAGKFSTVPFECQL